MKHLWVLGLSLMLLAACQSQPTIVDNGNPGEIQAIVFDDDNGNQKMDQGELGVITEVGISQEISCPPNRKESVTKLTTDADGIARFLDVKPGEYCVAIFENFPMTTRLTVEVTVSSDAVTTVYFGVRKEDE